MQLAASCGETILSTDSLEKLLQLALACEMGIARASTVNARGEQPVWKYLNDKSSEKPGSDVAAMLAKYIDSAKKKLMKEQRQSQQQVEQ